MPTTYLAMPAGSSPNATTPVCEAAQLHSPGAAPIAVGGPAWFAWLDAPGHGTLYLRDAAGSYTARRQQRRSGPYWYAYAKRGARLRKAYLGRGGGFGAHLSAAGLIWGGPGKPPKR